MKSSPLRPVGHCSPPWARSAQQRALQQRALQQRALTISLALVFNLVTATYAQAQLLDTAELHDRVGWSLAVGDFDGDANDDLAISAWGESVSTAVAEHGAVHVTYGSATGLSPAGQQFWHQNSPGMPGWAEPSDHFGVALAAGDFNCDLYDDLAIGVPGESLDINSATYPEIGAVHILYGSSNGLTTAGTQMWHPGIAAIGRLTTTQQFGFSLAAGDFDGDQCADLAVGAPYSNVAGVAGAGALRVLLGSATGLTSQGIWFDESASSVGGDVGVNDRFGFALATGELDGHSYDELIVGIPFEDLGATNDAGEVVVVRGSPIGLTTSGLQRWNQSTIGNETPETFDLFGYAVTTGDFGGDAAADLAIGVPYETRSNAQHDSGVVHVLYSSFGLGPTTTGTQIWHQDSYDSGAPIIGWSESNDRFGSSLAAGNFRTMAKQDLVVGSYGEVIAGSIANEGAVHVIYADTNLGRLSAVGNQMWHQNVPGISETCEKEDRFGHSLAVGSFDGTQTVSPLDDLAIGAPGEGHTSAVSTFMGAVHVITSSNPSVGLTATGQQLWRQ